jgi:hypothetical protein
MNGCPGGGLCEYGGVGPMPPVAMASGGYGTGWGPWPEACEDWEGCRDGAESGGGVGFMM